MQQSTKAYDCVFQITGYCVFVHRSNCFSLNNASPFAQRELSLDAKEIIISEVLKEYDMISSQVFSEPL